MSGYKTFLPPVGFPSLMGASIGATSLTTTPGGGSLEAVGQSEPSVDQFVNVPPAELPVTIAHKRRGRRNGDAQALKTYSSRLPKKNDTLISIHRVQECMRLGLYTWFAVDPRSGCETQERWASRHTRFLRLAVEWKRRFGRAVHDKCNHANSLAFAVGYKSTAFRAWTRAWLKLSFPHKKKGGNMHRSVVAEIIAQMPWLGTVATLQFTYGKQGAYLHDGYGLRHNLITRMSDGSIPDGSAWADFIVDNILPLILTSDSFEAVERNSGSVGYVLHGTPKPPARARSITTVLDARRERGPFSTPLFSWVTGYYDY